jgi:hypothetical protein
MLPYDIAQALALAFDLCTESLCAIVRADRYTPEPNNYLVIVYERFPDGSRGQVPPGPLATRHL